MAGRDEVDEVSAARPGQIVTFYSYKGGTGRSMALANMAWLLASSGLRVLAVDWDLEAPGLHRYFHPFLHDPELRLTRGVMDMIWDYTATVMSPESADEEDWFEKSARVAPYAVSLHWPFPSEGTIDFVCAGRHDAAYARRVSTFDWEGFYEDHGGGDFVDALGRNMRDSYDWVMIDSRTGLSDTAGICTVQLPDIVVNCFTLSTQSVEGAVAVARSVASQGSERKIRILPVPMRVEDGEQRKLDIGRDLARTRFKSFLAGMDAQARDRYWGDVEAPYKAFYAYEEILAVFGDRPHQEGSLLASYERLTAYLTDGKVTELPAQDELVRRRTLAAFERDRHSAPTDLMVSYAARDRGWAEWIAAELEDLGFEVTLQRTEVRPGADVRLEVERITGSRRTVAILSSAYVRSRLSAEWWRAAVARDPDGTQQLLVPLRVEDFRIPPEFTERVYVDLVGLDEANTRDALTSGVGRPMRKMPNETTPRANPPRFPGAPPVIWDGVPARNQAFTGREELVFGLRDRFFGGAETAEHAQVLHGLAGVGKTQVAVEYVFRFGSSYDLVCWIGCDQTALVRSSLGGLADRLGVPQEHSREPAEEVVDSLRRGQPYRRWLLVFDNADRPEDVVPFIPQGPGHVLVTSRNPGWHETLTRVEMSAFTREESIALLLRRAPGLTAELADRLAEALGDLPLALEHAGAWYAETGMSVDRYLELLETSPGPLLLEGEVRSYPRPVARTWTLSMNRLRKRSPVAARLAELCAFLGPEPISLLLFSGPGLRKLAVAGDQSLRDPIVLAKAVRQTGEHALVRVDQAGQSLAMHRLVQAVIRDDTKVGFRPDVTSRAHMLLAAADPGTPDEPASWSRYSLLRPHLEPSGALRSTADEVCQLVANQVRCLFSQGNYWACRDLARSALETWRRSLGDSDERTLRLELDLADSLRALGEASAARDLDEQTHAQLARILGASHPLTLRAASGLGGDLRGLGEYVTARALDEETYERYRTTLGLDDPETQKAANNLAVSLRFVGDFKLALEISGDTFDRGRRTRGEDDLYSLQFADSYARDLREYGNYSGSLALAKTTLVRRREVLGEHHPHTLLSLKNLAVSLRRAGHGDDARATSEDAYALSRDNLGENHLDTFAASVNLVGQLCQAGDTVAASRLASDTYERVRQRFGEGNLYTLAVANSLVVATRLDGDPASALTLATSTVARFRSTLGVDHPFTLSCILNLSSCNYDLGRITAARDLDQESVHQFEVRLGSGHPTTLLATMNLAMDLAALREGVTAEALRGETLARLAGVLGPDHPYVTAVHNRHRADFEIDPPPP